MKRTKPITRIVCATVLFILSSMTVFAQKTITGKVTNSKDGTGVQGVTVSVKGTSTSTQTGPDGTYSITVPTSTSRLLFSFVGFTPQETAASDKATVSLVETSRQLEDVVVVGYGTTRKKDLTGAVTTVSSRDFQKGNITTPEQLIAGKVPGVSIISNGGSPGSGSVIRIRGGSSLNASNDPLIVVDGIPLDHDGIAGAANPLSFINPNDIETFTVLKDASAAAIYGTRAANGVIIITTKKGRAGALKVNFSTVNSYSKITKQNDVLSANEVRQVVNQFGTAAQKAQLGSANTDWQDAIYREALSTDNNISITGGIKKLPYRLTLGYSYLNGVLRTDHLEKSSIALVLNPTFLNNHLKVDINLKGTAENARFGNQGAIGAAVAFDPTQPIYSNSSRYGGYFEWTEPTGELKLNRPNNPVGILQEQFDNQKPYRSIGNIQLDYKFPFLPDLHANLNLGYDVSKNTGTKFVSDSAAQNYVIGSPATGGQNQYGKQTKQNTVLDFYFNYVKEIPTIKSRIDATAGYSYNNYLATNYNYRNLTEAGDTIPKTTAPQFLFDKPQNTLIGIFARLNYVFNEKYLLTATIRRDGSSRFGKDNQWGTFPSVALGWKIKDEAFLKDSKGVSDLKLRAGYGITGQQDGIGNYAFLSTYALSSAESQIAFGNQYYQGYAPGGFYAGLKWEQTATLNAAVDYGFLKNRINGSIDFYYKKTTDLLNSIPQPAGTNFSAYVLANIGDMENKGVEFSINTQPVRKKNVSWDVNFNATYNKNEITNLTVVPKDVNYIGAPGIGAAGVNGPIFLNAVGGPKNTFYLYHQIYDQNGKPIEGLFEDVNRDGIINEKDKYKGKTADPNMFFGFSTYLTVKKWTAGFVLRATFNNYVYNNVWSNLGKLNQVDGAYTLGNASTNYLETGFTGGTDIGGLSDYYVQNASFLKMDNISLGYSFGKILRNRANLRLSANAQNVFTITNYKGLDPELSNGVDANLYPRPIIVSLGANLDF